MSLLLLQGSLVRCAADPWGCLAKERSRLPLRLWKQATRSNRGGTFCGRHRSWASLTTQTSSAWRESSPRVSHLNDFQSCFFNPTLNLCNSHVAVPKRQTEEKVLLKTRSFPLLLRLSWWLWRLHSCLEFLSAIRVTIISLMMCIIKIMRNCDKSCFYWK